MPQDMEALYQTRLARYTTAMRNEMPDMAPIRPFVAEFTAAYCGMTCQEVTHDYRKAFTAARRCAAEFDWDAVVSNMVYVWTGLTEAIGLRYYGVPGIDVPANTGFQYREPGEEGAHMKADEYDALIADPTGFLYNVWLPRVTRSVAGPGSPASTAGTLALVKGSMAMMQYFTAFGDQNAALRSESGTVSAIAGILKAPLDILGDKLRGYMGLTMDLLTQPEKVRRACEALAPHLLAVAVGSSDPTKQTPVGFWMHRGCVPFVTPQQFETVYWPTLKPIIEELWARGIQTLFYAEGKWDHHLARFRELPAGSLVMHVDQSDIFAVHRAVGDRFCLSGGIPNVLLSYGKPEEVREFTRKVLAEVGADGGYIVDAGAIMQNDTRTENLRAMTQAARDFGGYSRGHSRLQPSKPSGMEPGSAIGRLPAPSLAPGLCADYAAATVGREPTQGGADLDRAIWSDVEGLAYTFIWQVLLSF